MFIFLPPSEAKSVPQTGKKINYSKLHFPQLTKSRKTLVHHLEKLVDQPNALKTLKLTKGQIDQLELNRHLEKSFCARAIDIYTGVLYQQLNLKSHYENQNQIIIFSALWGVIDPRDLIPAYRLSAGCNLPELGKVSNYWKPILKNTLQEIDSPDQLIIDCRSADYQLMWMPDQAKILKVGAVNLDGLGNKRVVSHWAKHIRGKVAQVILEYNCQSIDDVFNTLDDQNFQFEHINNDLTIILRS